MLLVPYVVGVVMAGLDWVHVPLLVAWLAGYLWSYYAALAVKTRRLSRVRDQVLLYGAVTLPAALVVVAARPRVLVFAPFYAALLAVNAWFSWRRDDRAAANDLVSVVLGCLMIPVAAIVAGASPAGLWDAFVIVFAYFAGTVLYVKTMVRERGRRGYLVASIAFHAVAAVVAALVAWPLGVLFALFLVRAVLAPRYALSPKQIGFIEIGGSVALLVLVPLLT